MKFSKAKKQEEVVVQNAVKILKPVLAELKEKESIIGIQISQALNKGRLEERTVGACPKCADGKLVILRSKKTGKRFVGCTNYFKGKCNVTFPLPQTGGVKPLKVTCKNCGYPMLRIYMKGKRTWKSCLNPDCPSKGTCN